MAERIETLHEFEIDASELFEEEGRRSAGYFKGVKKVLARNYKDAADRGKVKIRRVGGKPGKRAKKKDPYSRENSSDV